MINLKEFKNKYIEQYRKERSDTLIVLLCDIFQQIGIIQTENSWADTTKLDIRSAVIIEILKERLNDN